MRSSDSFSHQNSWRLSLTALCGCLVIMTTILTCLMDSTSNTIASLSLQLSGYRNVSLRMVEEPNTEGQGEAAPKLPQALKENQGGKESSADAVLTLPSSTMEEKKLDESTTGNQTVPLQQQYEEKQGSSDVSSKGSLVKESRVVCDFTAPRSDTCWMDGDVRVLGKSSLVMLASPPTDRAPTHNTTWKIRPYPRKWETTMELIKELTVTVAAEPEQAPRCMVNHSVPAVFFSTGGFVGNYFHDFTDVIIPLFMTSRRFNGEVRLVVTDFNHQFMDKYQQILKQLSHYPAIDLDADDRVHCFPHAHVGLFSHRALGIDSSKSPDGISMSDFRSFLRKSFSLRRAYSKEINLRSRRKPRLLLILRKGSRSFVNEREVMRMVKGLGFKLITAGPEETKNISRFAQVVNSVDVLMGIHGSGLTNMVFLPSNATVVQIIPCCGLADGCRYIFGEPAPDMGVRYVEYEIGVEESSLAEQYPRDHEVFRDPISIQKQQGFNEFWNIFLNKQMVKLDVPRFRSTLSQVLQSIKY
ncbi:hypothetical protein MUK42_29376 [Musa troglodytarum]|uniref:Glycosyltransferase 61 catalytic domain-containing protein n=1 Tax=Musa troglodytarum TaxID=320322 RepID=A0A9E7FL72_9LILI|nr:hypothetical protein MUK42_29376 [Musa troglodytarum]